MDSIFTVGTRHEVQWRDTSREADILQIRLLDSKVVISSEPSIALDDSSSDKRLDEWITIDRFIQNNSNNWADKPGSVTRVNKHAESEAVGIKYTRQMNEENGRDEERNGNRAEEKEEEEDYIDVERIDPDDISLSSSRGQSVSNDGVESMTSNGYGHHHDDEGDEDHEHPTSSNVRNIEQVVFGSFLIDTWYYSPYAEEYSKLDRLYVCEFCFKYMKYPKTYIRHQSECTMRQPPGTLIYRYGNTKVYEIDGHQHKLYCQNLCLFAKLFLDQKTVFYDVVPFLFYVMAVADSESGHTTQRVVAYFSKEKQSIENYNLACITTFPPYQKRGYGRFLIELSYELSKLENTTGHPEKPLSDLGLRGYESFWIASLLRALIDQEVDDVPEGTATQDVHGNGSTNMEITATAPPSTTNNIGTSSLSSVTLDGNEQRWATISVMRLSRETGIRPEDVLYTLELLHLLPLSYDGALDEITEKATGVHANQSKFILGTNSNNNNNNNSSNNNNNLIITVTHEHLQSLVQMHRVSLDQMVDPSKITWEHLSE
ncbi:acyl-CoA N-acyltransferase [Syncephalis fuscata]|nr:acyl-CoA N-acyltransferase [Syncephalis fuscata]